MKVLDLATAMFRSGKNGTIIINNFNGSGNFMCVKPVEIDRYPQFRDRTINSLEVYNGCVCITLL